MMKKYEDNYQVDFSKRDVYADVNELFYTRWSPRSFKKADIPTEDIATIMEAARWAPSCFNEQPWIIITNKGKEDFDLYLSLLNEQNKIWAVNASVLGFLFARRVFSHSGLPNEWARFDCGAAWMSMALQARLLGLYTHAMGGIIADETYSKLNISKEKYEVICGFAIGILDEPEKLPDALKKMEMPNIRKLTRNFWKQGKND